MKFGLDKFGHSSKKKKIGLLPLEEKRKHNKSYKVKYFFQSFLKFIVNKFNFLNLKRKVTKFKVC